MIALDLLGFMVALACSRIVEIVLFVSLVVYCNVLAKRIRKTQDILLRTIEVVQEQSK